MTIAAYSTVDEHHNVMQKLAEREMRSPGFIVAVHFTLNSVKRSYFLLHRSIIQTVLSEIICKSFVNRHCLFCISRFTYSLS